MINTVTVSIAVDAIAIPIKDATGIGRAIEAIAREPNSALLFPGEITTIAHSELIVALAAEHRSAAIYTYSFWVARGGLMSYGIDPVDCASYVDRLLRGERPADLPVQFPTEFELAINLKTAKALGLDVSPTLIAHADEVID